MTAVEEFWKDVQDIVALSVDTNTVIKLVTAYHKAKEMEKHQMINARQSGIDATINGKSISNIDYYNETFKPE
jgi:hypothetical protein